MLLVEHLDPNNHNQVIGHSTAAGNEIDFDVSKGSNHDTQMAVVNDQPDVEVTAQDVNSLNFANHAEPTEGITMENCLDILRSSEENKEEVEGGNEDNSVDSEGDVDGSNKDDRVVGEVEDEEGSDKHDKVDGEEEDEEGGNKHDRVDGEEDTMN